MFILKAMQHTMTYTCIGITAELVKPEFVCEIPYINLEVQPLHNHRSCTCLPVCIMYCVYYKYCMMLLRLALLPLSPPGWLSEVAAWSKYCCLFFCCMAPFTSLPLLFCAFFIHNSMDFTLISVHPYTP